MNNSKHPDAIAGAPEAHKILFENDKFRVIEVKLPPGDKTAVHWHPDNVSYAMAPGKMRFYKEDGSTIETSVAQGQVTAGAGVHAVENIGENLIHTIQVELK